MLNLQVSNYLSKEFAEESAAWVLTHELFHEAAKSNIGLSERIVSAFEAAEIYDGRDYEAYDELYRENYEKEYENLSEAEKENISLEEYAERYVTEEIAADLMQKVLGSEELAKMFAAKAETKDLNFIAKFIRSFIEKIKGVLGKSGANERFIYDANSVCGIFERAVKESANKKSSAGTEQKFKLVGKNKNGIEVYETSEEIRSLSKKEKIQKFFDIMQNEYKGRTAKFVKDGKAYYARFADIDVRKNVYGDKLSDSRGKKAKLNLEADGDVFSLVENSVYKNSKSEIGKKNKAHKNVTEWDYFLKTVQIDGATFDLVANVRKANNKQFVYYLKLTENKNVTLSTPRGSSQLGSVNVGTQQRYNDIVSQEKENVNRENEKSAKNSKKIVDDEVKLAKKGKTFSYAELTALPDMEIPFIDSNVQIKYTADGRIDKKYILETVRKKCEQINHNSESPTFVTNVPALGGKAEITGNSLKHGLINGLNKNKNISEKTKFTARAELMLPEILKNSIEVNRKNSRGKETLYTSVLLGAVAMENDGKTDYYAVRSVFEIGKNKNPTLVEYGVVGTLYAVNTKIADFIQGSGVKNNNTPRPTFRLPKISISQLLDFVKGVFEDTFSEDVYLHLNTQRKETDFSDGLRFAKKGKRKKGLKKVWSDEAFFAAEAERERKIIESETVSPNEAEFAMQEQEKLRKGAPKRFEKRNGLSIEERGKIETEIGKIAKELNVDKIEKEKFTSEVSELAEKFVKDGNIKQEDVDGLANKLFTATQVDTAAGDFAATVRNAVKRINSTKLYVSPEVRGDIADYREFAKKFGFSKLTKDSKNIPLDVFYAELQSDFPDLGLKKDAVLGDMLYELMRVKELGYESAQKQTVGLSRIMGFDEAISLTDTLF